MGLIDNIGVFRDKLAKGKFEVIEAFLPRMNSTLTEVLRREKQIIKDGHYTELSFNSADLTETAEEINNYAKKIRNKIKGATLLKLNKGVDETVDLWNRYTDFLFETNAISYKLHLLGYLMLLIENNTVDDAMGYTMLKTLQDLAKE